MDQYENLTTKELALLKFLLARKNYHVEDVSNHPTRENLIKTAKRLINLLWEVYGKTLEINSDETKLRIYESQLNPLFNSKNILDENGKLINPEPTQRYVNLAYKQIQQEEIQAKPKDQIPF